MGTNRYAYSFNDPVNLSDPGGNVLFQGSDGSQTYHPPTSKFHESHVAGDPQSVRTASAVSSGAANYDPQDGWQSSNVTASSRSGAAVLAQPAAGFLAEELGIGAFAFGTVFGVVAFALNPTRMGDGTLPDGFMVQIEIMKPVSDAWGPPSTIKYGPNGEVEHYQEWTENSKNPSGFDAGKRYDGVGAQHRGKDGIFVPTPHVHTPGGRGIKPGVREPKPDEIPSKQN